MLLGSFAGLALLLAAVGVYGVISQSVGARIREIGIRLALGASPSHVRRMVIKEGLVLSLIGIAIGLAGSLAATRLLASLLFGVETTDPLTFVTVSGLLVAVACLASYLPARRAMKVDPMSILRTE